MHTMRTRLSLLASLTLAAAAAVSSRADAANPPSGPVTFTTVDAMTLGSGTGFTLTGVEQGKAVASTYFFNTTAQQAYDGCQRMAFVMANRPGRFTLYLSGPFVNECTLTRVP